jgi:hypothetical protein
MNSLFSYLVIIRRIGFYFPRTGYILTHVFNTIIGYANRDMAIIADALAQLRDKNSRGDSSGYDANIPVSDISSSSPSTIPTTAAPSYMVSTGTATNNKDFTTQAAISSLTARPTNNIVNTNSFYDVVFLTPTAGATYHYYMDVQLWLMRTGDIQIITVNFQKRYRGMLQWTYTLIFKRFIKIHPSLRELRTAVVSDESKLDKQPTSDDDILD